MSLALEVVTIRSNVRHALLIVVCSLRTGNLFLPTLGYVMTYCDNESSC